MAPAQKFVSIIWGYHKQIFTFTREQNYHLLPVEVMSKKGYVCEIFAIDSQVEIEKDPNFPKNTKVIYYSGFTKYIGYLWQNRQSLVYVNSLTLKTLFSSLILRRSIFMAHDQVLPLASKRFKRIVTLFFYRFFSKIRVINSAE